MNDDDFPTTMSPAMHAGVHAIALLRAGRSPTSRNAREGRYIGFAWGQHVRWRHARRRRVRRAKALAVLHRRREQQIERHLARNR